MKHIQYPVVYEERGTMIVDSSKELICDIRGWGRFQKMKHGENEQDSVGKFIAEAINEKLLQEGGYK